MELKQAIIIRADLGMGKGKIASQAAHASLAAIEKTQVKEKDWARQWKEQGQAKIVLKIAGKKELLELFESAKGELPAVLIKDAGRTQISPGETTAVGLGPAPENKIDKYIKDLKLL
jgi:peptidyl-tRNA hydrolase, PTH2 family